MAEYIKREAKKGSQHDKMCILSGQGSLAGQLKQSILRKNYGENRVGITSVMVNLK